MTQDSAVSPDLSHANEEKVDKGTEALSTAEITQEKIRLNNPNVDYTRCRDIIDCLSTRTN
jgi:translation initiation factor eIF-2B subunit alpha